MRIQVAAGLDGAGGAQENSSMSTKAPYVAQDKFARDMNGNVKLGRGQQPIPFRAEDMPLVALLGPRGEIQHHQARDNGGGDSICKWDRDGIRLVIPRKWADKGWCFYWDVCQGNYTPMYGGEAIRAPEKYDDWEAGTKEIAEGHAGAPTPPGFYHPEVVARLEKRRGMETVKPGSVFDHAQGDAIEDAAQKKRRAKRKGGSASAQA